MARSKPYGTVRIGNCAVCGKRSSKNIRPRADSELALCDFCLGCLIEIARHATDERRAEWLFGTASERCSFWGRTGEAAGGLIAHNPTFVCVHCVELARRATGHGGMVWVKVRRAPDH